MSGNTVTVVVSSRRFTQVSTAHFLAKTDSLMGVSEIIWCPVIGSALYSMKMVGLKEVKKEQRRALHDFVSGRDVFVSLPTGYDGKSFVARCVRPSSLEDR